MKSNLKKVLALSAFLMLLLCTVESSKAHFTAYPETLFNKETVFGGAYLQFANKMGGEVSKADIVSQRELGVAGCAAGSRIFQFTLHITKDGKRSSFTNKSHIFSKEIIQGLSTLSAGDSFEFKGIKAYLPKNQGVVDVHSNKFIVV